MAGATASLRAAFAHALEHAAHLLPAQAPIARFVHHNTLHAFEDRPFDAALLDARAAFGAEPYLDESLYAAAVASGRIRRDDLEAALVERGVAATPPATGLPTARELALLRLLAPLPDAAGDAVDWLCAETDLLRAPRPELDAASRRELERSAAARGWSVAGALRALWDRSLGLARDRPATAAMRHDDVRLRDRVLAATGRDADELVHPLLIRLVAAYLDQGVAYWPMPDRDGLWPTFRRLAEYLPLPPWADGLREELAHDEAADVGAWIERELELRGVGADGCDALAHAACQALPGWAGMVHQLETRPDLAPGRVPPIALRDFIAIRLLLDRLAARHVTAAVGPVAAAVAPDPDPRALALEIFVLAQRAGLDATDLGDPTVGAAFAAHVAGFDRDARRAVFHLAYERRYRVRLFDALAARLAAPVPAPARPWCQVLFCIDEREESFRRHLEEVEPRVETFGYAGNFEVMMSYVGLGAPHAVPLCPPVVTPRHRVREVAADGVDPRGALARRRRLGRTRGHRHVATRALVRGGFVALTGVVGSVPLVARTLFPGLTDAVARALRERLAPAVATELVLTRADGEGPAADGLFEGYTLDEQAGVVAAVLRAIGLTGRVTPFADLVVVSGHGSSSVNNPHAAAYNCGACAGGHSGANARVFARMANDPQVRVRLAALGIAIPATTVFVGAGHDTASDVFTCYDAARLPERAVVRLAELRAAIEIAAARTAHERCRRFPDAPLDMTPARALRHARARTVDLAQPRPEYCHATNAVAFVGRRARTRGMFLDRRAFLVSYDPREDDADGSVLERVLAQVTPVGAGINLEYYFSRVDQERYGSGTKLPHNLSGLLGVMNGHASDLRPGLHWQTVDLHEPMRLLVVIDADRELVARIVARNPALARFVGNRWVLAATIDPADGAIDFLTPAGFARHAAGAAGEPVARAADSRAFYAGRRDHVVPALIDAAVPGEGRR